MSDSFRFWMILLGGVVAIYIAYHIVLLLVAKLVALVIPILVIGFVGYLLYSFITRKALGGGSRRLLP